MIASEETAGPDAGSVDDQRVGTLRGAGVQVDSARAAQVATVLVLVTLVVVAAVFFVAGYRKNAQIEDLKSHGVPVVMTITYNEGLLGGSGSNGAGYASGGTYTYGGHTYTESVPDDQSHVPGTTVHGVVSSTNPGLFSLPGVVASEHTSASVYVVPLVLLAVAAGFGGWLLVRRRRHAGA